MLNRTALYELCQRIKLLKDVDLWLNSFDARTFEQIKDFIKNDQLKERGIDATGQVIGTYSENTERMNPQKKAGSHYTLDDTGEFLQSLTIHVFQNYILIDANGDKGEVNLFDEFGDDIIGLTDENIQKLKVLLIENGLKYARKLLQLD